MPIDPVGALQSLYQQAQVPQTQVKRPGSALLDPDDWTQASLSSVDPQSGGVSQRSPLLMDYLFKNQLKGELEDRAVNGDPRAIASLGVVNQDLATHPLTQQKQQVDAFNQAQQSAITKGYTGGTPTMMTPDMSAVAPKGSPQTYSYMSGPQQLPSQQQAADERYAALQKTIAPEIYRAQSAKELEQMREAADKAQQDRLMTMLSGGQIAPGGSVQAGKTKVAVGGGQQLTGPLGKDYGELIKQWSGWQNTSFPMGHFMASPEAVQTKLADLERQLDSVKPGWRKLQAPGSRFATAEPAAGQQVPGGGDARRLQAVQMLQAAGNSTPSELQIQAVLSQLR